MFVEMGWWKCTYTHTICTHAMCAQTCMTIFLTQPKFVALKHKKRVEVIGKLHGSVAMQYSLYLLKTPSYLHSNSYLRAS